MSDLAKDLIVKYRPETFDDVYGHDDTIKSLKSVLKRDAAHAFLFFGPSGVGKTTIARIIADELDCNEHNLREIDGATYTKIDDMRKLKEQLQFVAIGKSKTKVVIIDECHRLSQQAWDSILKDVEEPRANTYWIFCTTNLHKVPKTIHTRCLMYQLDLVADSEIRDLLEWVNAAEKFELGSDILSLITLEAFGSPRRALGYMTKCVGCKNRKQAARILGSIQESKEAIELYRMLVKGTKWGDVVTVLKSIEKPQAEAIRIEVTRYVAAVLLNTSNEKNAVQLLRILEAFSTPCNQNDGLAPILLALGEVIFAD